MVNNPNFLCCEGFGYSKTPPLGEYAYCSCEYGQRLEKSSWRKEQAEFAETHGKVAKIIDDLWWVNR